MTTKENFKTVHCCCCKHVGDCETMKEYDNLRNELDKFIANYELAIGKIPSRCVLKFRCKKFEKQKRNKISERSDPNNWEGLQEGL